MRPTTKDLASHLGMSRSTVDRVLNGRPGVKAATVQAVENAIKELGFERNISAANLARKRVYRILFLMPKARGDFVNELTDQISALTALMRRENVEVDVRRVLETDQHKIVAVLSRLSPDAIDGVAILAPESPQVRDAVTRVAERGINVVRIISGRSDTAKSDFVGIDNVAAGQTAGRLLGGFCKHLQGKVAVITDTMTSSDSAERRIGFDGVLQTKFPQYTALPTLETRGDPDRAQQVLTTVFDNFADIVGVYIMGSEAAFVLQAMDRLDRFDDVTVVAHERTRSSVSYLAQDKVDALIVQDPGHVIRSAIRILRARCDRQPPLAEQNNIRIEILLKENLVHQELARGTDD